MREEDFKGNPKLLEVTPVKAIRAKCLDCCCGSINEVKLCTKDGIHSDYCPLWQYRLGKRPKRAENPLATWGENAEDAEDDMESPSEDSDEINDDLTSDVYGEDEL